MKSALIRVLFLLFAIGVFGDAVKAEIVSVIEGDSVTLHTGVTEIQRDDLIEWKLNGNLIAIIRGGNIKPNGGFRDGMKLDKQTGDLKITNIKTTDSGLYKVEITSNRGSPEKTFSVSAVNRFDGVTVVAVTEGDSVVLHTDTEILKDDEILWRFREKYDIAKMKKDEDIFSTYDGIADGIFRGRLHLDHQTGNLIISHIRFKTSGLYEVYVKKSTHTIHKAFSVTITDRLNRLSVKAGVTVTLESGVTELHRDDLVRWRFEHGDVLAEINKTAGIFSTYDDVPDGRFRGRLELDHQTGSLTITHTKTSDSGLYHLDITGDRHTIFRKYIISASGSDYVTWIAVVLGVLLVAAVACVICYCYRRYKLVPRKVTYGERNISVEEGKSVTLETETEINQADQIQWSFGDQDQEVIIAEIKRGREGETHDHVLDGRFRGRLTLDNQTGSLTITNIRTEHTGVYKLLISRSRETTIKRFGIVYRNFYEDVLLLNQGYPDLDVENAQEGTSSPEIRQDMLTSVNHSDINNISAPAATTGLYDELRN